MPPNQIAKAQCLARERVVRSRNDIKISTDRKGGRRDNVFVERLWKSVQYDEVYLRAHDAVSHARDSIGLYLVFYNSRRPHSRLGRSTPDQAYFNPPLLAAA